MLKLLVSFHETIVGRRIEMADAAALSLYDRWIARREAQARLCAAGGEDRLSALPDDVLHLIIRRLDTRGALATAALSKRWAQLPRELPVLEFRVGDVLPDRYRVHLRRRLDALGRQNQRASLIRKLDEFIGRCERQAMRSLASSVSSFLDADSSDDDGHGGEARRSAQALILELFPTHNPAPFHRLIAKAIGDWGIQNLEIVVFKPTPSNDNITYRFPHHCFELEHKPPGSLKRLSLNNCVPLTARDHLRAPQAFRSLAVLVLQGMPKWPRLYQRVVRACPMLEVLHLKSCLFRGKVSLDAPDSRVAEIVMDACTFRAVTLGSLPKLERLAWSGAPVELIVGSLPRLRHLNLSFYDDPNAGPDPRYAAFFGPAEERSSLRFSSRFSNLECLVVRFTGPEMWIVPDLRVPLGNLRRLDLVGMPRSWDMLWACRLLEAAPYLDTLNVHVDDHNSWETAFGPSIPKPPTCFKHNVLREVVILGFQGTGAQLHFVRFLRNACKALKSVALLKHGHIQACEGLWKWEVVASTVECQWSDEEKDILLSEINSGNIASSTTNIILG